jgi:hypothetical protein
MPNKDVRFRGTVSPTYERWQYTRGPLTKWGVYLVGAFVISAVVVNSLSTGAYARRDQDLEKWKRENNIN